MEAETTTNDHGSLIKSDTCPGPILRIGPNMLIFNDYEAVEQIYGPNPQLVKNSYRYAAVSASHTPNLVTENDPHKANMKRKAHLDMWNNRSLKVAEPRLHALLDTFVSTLTSTDWEDPPANAASWGKTINLT
jgi:hypothetical protein